MTTTPPPSGAPEMQQPAPFYPPQPAGAPLKRRNVVGIVALAIAAVGFIFACVPGALILGWMLLPVGFVLGVIAVCLSRRVKWQGVAAIIVSVVGTIVGFLVFTFVVAGALSDAVDEASGGTTTVNEVPAAAAAAEDETTDEAASDEPTGTREDPLPFAASISNNDWDVTLNSFERDGNDVVMAGNMFNGQPAGGQQYVILDMTATYKGTGDGTSALVQVEYVAADGTVISTWDNFVSGVEPTFGSASLLAGASDTGKQVYLVPSTLDGLIRVTPGMLADEIYFQLP